MSKYFHIALLLLAFTLVNSTCRSQNIEEPNTLLSAEQITGYGRLDIIYSNLMNNDLLLLGGEGGIILNRHLTLGLSAQSTITEIQMNEKYPSYDHSIQIGYGGLVFGYIIAPKNLIHLSTPISLGIGQINLYDKIVGDINQEYIKVDIESSYFLYISPSLQMELNMTKFLKINTGIGYRFHHNVNLETPIHSNDLNSWFGNFSIILGKF